MALTKEREKTKREEYERCSCFLLRSDLSLRRVFWYFGKCVWINYFMNLDETVGLLLTKISAESVG